MPDDIKQEVTEQDEPGDEGFSGGFQDEAQTKGEEPEKKEAEPEKKEQQPEDKKQEPEKKEAKAEVKEKVEKGKAKEKEEELPEEDEVDLRGKHLLDEEKKAEEAATKLREEAATKKVEEEAKKAPPPIPFSEDLAKVYLDLANTANLPKTLKLGETELELKDFVEANPEFTVLAGMEATNIIQRLVDQGTLITADGHKADMAKMLETIDLRLFDMEVRRHVSNPAEIWDSKEFQEFHEKAPDSFKALFRSKDPMDHVKGFNKYLGKATEEIKAKVKEVDAEAAKKKKTHDDIHAHTLRSGKSATPAQETFVDTDEEFSAGFRDQA